ncbi:MAG: glucose-1-phosphate thymidylyltransferase [Betaproteobacteria bacterium TMED82]|nr:MAG: glucose-1-phosphate thymidylyltransferase [Betaproteobacteria bacterium TMED82]|tara:strand:- start:19168 stop:20061 length:894 start_codon:yes stop_codon:yes gene_type:complete
MEGDSFQKKSVYRKGIVLAGGTGSRLFPITIATSKQLLAIYDKPLIYYPLSVLMLADIRDILIICTEKDLKHFQDLLKDGNQIGISISYAIQEKPEGIAQAFLIGKNFLSNKPSALILGDNIFYGQGLSKILMDTSAKSKGATIFGYPVEDPQRFGVVEYKDDKVITIQEKPKSPKSNVAITGLYFYDGDVSSRAQDLLPSSRGELEITDLNMSYLKTNDLTLHNLGRGFAWFDTGTHDSLIDASQFIRTIENRQGLKISCPEEIAWKKGWVSDSDLLKMADALRTSSYGQYLLKLL